jgi:membrane protein required for beta-lactamase induction
VIEQESLVNHSSVGSLAGSLVLLLLVIRILHNTRTQHLEKSLVVFCITHHELDRHFEAARFLAVVKANAERNGIHVTRKMTRMTSRNAWIYIYIPNSYKIRKTIHNNQPLSSIRP